MNTVGSSVSEPAGKGEAIETVAWSVTYRDAKRGTSILELYPADDHRTRNMAETNPLGVPTWIAFRVTVTSASARERYFPPTAFIPVAADGTPVVDFLTLTQPDPDVAETYAIGESREGWVVFQPASETELGDLIRFLPFRTDVDPRYLTLAGQVANSDGSGSPVATFLAGQDVVITEDGVNLRAAASTSAEVVAVLSIGTVLTVTDTPTEGGGRTWYPVAVAESGATGYVAAEYMAPSQS